MKNKELLIQLYTEMKDEYQKYVRVIEIVRKLNSIIDGTRDITILNDSDLELFDNDGKFIVENIKFVSTFRLSSFSNEEKNNSLNYIKEQLIKGLGNNLEYYEKLGDNLDYLSNLDNALNDVKNNYSLIMDFVELSYRNKKITVEQAVAFNIDIVNEYMSKSEENEEMEEVIYENSESIDEELGLLFERYGYDFSLLNERIRNKFNKYAKVDYVDYVLSKLVEHGISLNEVKLYEKTILKIIIDRKNNTFDEVCEFCLNNNCRLSTMLSFDSIFHKRKKKYVSKNGQSVRENVLHVANDTDLVVVGSYDDSMKNIELLRNNNGNDNKTLDELLRKCHTFVSESHAKILKNLEILRMYGIIERDEFPKDVSCLIGNFTAYQLDRFIEVGLEDYIKKNTSYVNRTKSPFKFYKIRRGNDLGDIITRGRGIRKDYSDDNVEMYGISKVQIGDKVKINQRYLTYDQLESIPNERKRMINASSYYHKRLPRKEYLKKLYKDSYFYQEFRPSKIFSRENLSLSYIVDSIFQSDDYDCEYALSGIYDNEYIKMLDNYFCSTMDGSCSLKIDENTYEFKPYKFPHLGIKISRQKVLRLVYLLEQNGILLDKDLSLENRVNVLLSMVVKDSVLTYWEFVYIRNILRNVVDDLERQYSRKKDYNHERGAR